MKLFLMEEEINKVMKGCYCFPKRNSFGMMKAQSDTLKFHRFRYYEIFQATHSTETVCCGKYASNAFHTEPLSQGIFQAKIED